MASHSCILAGKILQTEEPGGLQSMGSQMAAQTTIGLHSASYPLPAAAAAAAAAAKSLQSCLTLCDPIDGSPPGSPIPGFLQARTLEWVAISFSNA